MNLRLLGSAVALAGLLISGVAVTAPAQAQTAIPPLSSFAQRGEGGSARNLVHVRHRLEALIDQMQRDQHDYGGYRAAAVQALQQARGDIVQAINYDATHPGH